jgi:hypothetical protein
MTIAVQKRTKMAAENHQPSQSAECKVVITWAFDAPPDLAWSGGRN